MAEQVIVAGTPVDEAKKVTQFGAIGAPKPQWATWMFRSVFITTTAISFWIGGTHLITDANKVELILGGKVLDMLALGFANLFGVVIPEANDTAKP